jgi:aryl-alcohol dehydrogenase-like predicted oxidoreductase
MWLRAQSGTNATCFPEDTHLWRSFHPAHLEQQLNRSLSRMSLDAVDIVLLESPEFLFDVSMNTQPQASDEDHAAFVYGALVKAFECLEGLVRQGRLSWYGVSSDVLSNGESNQLTIALERLFDCAQQAGGADHHLGVIQLPLSVLDMRSSGETESDSVHVAASGRGLGVMAGRPLQAVVEGRLVRLTDFNTDGSARVGRLMQSAVALEKEFSAGLGKAFEMEGMEDNSQLFDNAKRLVEVADALNDYVLWREFVEDVLELELSGLIGQIDAGLTGPLKVAWTFWLERYIKAISLLVDGLTLRSARVSQRQSRRIAKWLRPLVPDASNSAALAQLSLAVVRDLPGVHSVLVGMRRIQYAIDAMETMHWPIRPQSVERVHAISERFVASGAS